MREELREELQDIFKQREAIVVYTTTEPAEALMLGGDIVILDEGRVLQAGPTPDVYRHPATLRVAEVFSDPPINYLSGQIRNNAVYLGSDSLEPIKGITKSLPEGSYRFGIRSHHLFLNPSSPHDIEIQATVTLSEINGSETFLHVSYDQTPLVVQENGVHKFKIGSAIKIYVNPERFFIYDDAGTLVDSPDS